MTLEQKNYLIEVNKTTAIAAIKAYLDRVYELSEMFLDENNELKEGLTKDDKMTSFLQELKTEDSTKYENLMKKLVNDDFNLSQYEVNLISLAFMYISIVWKNQAKLLTDGAKEAEKLWGQLMSKD